MTAEPTRSIDIPGVEWFCAGEETLAVVIRAGTLPDRTTFVTPDHFTQQAGFIVYPRDGVIAAHDHKPIERHLTGTAETLLVLKGCLQTRLYNAARELTHTLTLGAGDILMLVSGGHGFTMLEDTVLFELKQGPYTGLVEKERFE